MRTSNLFCMRTCDSNGQALHEPTCVHVIYPSQATKNNFGCCTHSYALPTYVLHLQSLSQLIFDFHCCHSVLLYYCVLVLLLCLVELWINTYHMFRENASFSMILIYHSQSWTLLSRKYLYLNSSESIFNLNK